MLKRYIEVKGQYDGFHKYEDAPDQVAFLRNNHRHLFKWEATIEVFHDDRELEFFLVQAEVNKCILPFLQINKGANLGSCEQQGEIILNGLKAAYGEDRFYLVKVSEDGENAGIVRWSPTT